MASGKLDQVPLLAFPGLSLVEWSRAENGQKVRLLLANGADVCAFGIRVAFDEYQTDLLASLPPRGLKIVEIDGPKQSPLSAEDVTLDATFGTCVDDAGPPPVPTGWRLICSSPGRWPDVEKAVEVRLPDLPPVPPDRVPFALGATVSLGGLELDDLSVRLGPAGWVFEAEIANSGDFKARPLTIDVEMSFEGSSLPPQRRTLVYTLGNLRRGHAGKFSSVVAARAAERTAKPRFRIVSVRQVEAAAAPERKVTLGVD